MIADNSVDSICFCVCVWVRRHRYAHRRALDAAGVGQGVSEAKATAFR